MQTAQVLRLVGYYEYMQALSRFDALVNRLSPEELLILEEIVKDRDEFSVYTNISRRVEKQPSSLSEPPLAAGDQFQRRGLSWMMALARVELGAMVVGFTDHAEPFKVLPPTRYDAAQFKEMMLDGLRMHYLALQNDPVTGYYWSMRTGRPGALEINEVQAIAYSRRVLLAIEFAEAVQQFDLTPEQQLQVAAWRKDLEKLLEVILLRALQLGLADVDTTINTSSTRAVDETKGGCLCLRSRELMNSLSKQGKIRSDQRQISTQKAVQSGGARSAGR